MTKSVLRIQHITAIAGEPEQNILFCTRLMGLRQVKITVKFDDPARYHLDYGDRQGHPGTMASLPPYLLTSFLSRKWCMVDSVAPSLTANQSECLMSLHSRSRRSSAFNTVRRRSLVIHSSM
jgi:hypothetical protein